MIHKLETAALEAQDLSIPLRILGSRLKRRALERYKGQAFPPLAASTLEHRASKGMASLEGKLRRDVRRAKQREASKRSPPGFMAKLLGASVGDVAVGESRGVQNRVAALLEFQRRHRRGGLYYAAGGKALSLKQHASLTERETRAVARAVGGPILGQLPRTLQVVIEEGSVTLRSRTHEEWSSAHNEGATVGHGAKLPQRETVTLDDSDIEFFITVLKEHHLMPFQEGMNGPGF